MTDKIQIILKELVDQTAIIRTDLPENWVQAMYERIADLSQPQETDSEKKCIYHHWSEEYPHEGECVYRSKPQPLNWEEEIRNTYKGILPSEQIEATVEYWRTFILSLLQRQREELVREIEGMKKELHPSGHHIRRQALDDILLKIKK